MPWTKPPSICSQHTQCQHTQHQTTRDLDQHPYQLCMRPQLCTHLACSKSHGIRLGSHTMHQHTHGYSNAAKQPCHSSYLKVLCCHSNSQHTWCSASRRHTEARPTWPMSMAGLMGLPTSMTMSERSSCQLPGAETQHTSMCHIRDKPEWGFVHTFGPMHPMEACPSRRLHTSTQSASSSW